MAHSQPQALTRVTHSNSLLGTQSAAENACDASDTHLRIRLCRIDVSGVLGDNIPRTEGTAANSTILVYTCQEPKPGQDILP